MSIHIEKLDLSHTEIVENELKKLGEVTISSVSELQEWLESQTKIYDTIDEILIGHYIDFQCHSNDEEAKKKFEYDQLQIQPLLKRYKHLLDQKFMRCPYVSELDSAYYNRFIKSKENAMRLYSKENIELEIKEDQLVTKYFELTGGLTVPWDREEITINEARLKFQDPDRSIRKQAMTLVFDAFGSIEDELQDILSKLIQLRDKKAKNVGFDNFRDYMFAKYERFDYTPKDCSNLAESVAKYVTPLKAELDRKHISKLNVEDYRPWDQAAVPKGLKPLKPFETTGELVDLTAKVFNQMDPQFSSLLRTMDAKGNLDLESRKGKAQGGFCEYLPVSEMSFIFMNAAQSDDDVRVLLHEMGHCIHDYLKKGIVLNKYREIPMESAELASMSMELLTMDRWEYYYHQPDDLNRAKVDQLEGVIGLPLGGMLIDQFQHWLYENPNHTVQERKSHFRELATYFSSGEVNWDGYEHWLETQWLIVLHIFEVPFYYIEYVIAQLGAVQMYMNYKKNPEETLQSYKKALSLGSTKSLPEVYKTAGIQFDFSEAKIKELMSFLKEELDLIEA